MNRRSLYRCRHDRRVAGVAAGVAEFFDLDPTLVRLVWFLSIFFGGFGLLLYIVMAIIVPNEPLSEEELAAPADAGSPHRHAGRSGNGGLGLTFVGLALILFGGLALANTFFVEWGYSGSFLWPGFILAIGVLLVAAAFRRGEPEPTELGQPPAPPAPPAPGAAGRTDERRSVIAAPILIVGLLLVLTSLFSARIPGEASFASSGIPFAPRREGAGVRDPIRAFLLSPFHPATWNAIAFVLIGFVVGVVAFAAIVSVFSAGVASILAGIGIVLIVLGIEGSRFVARLERRRARLADPAPLIAHPYKPLRGGFMDLVRAEFVDEARWRDVLYVGVNFPLVVIEFFLVVAIWGATLALLSAPAWEGASPSGPGSWCSPGSPCCRSRRP